MAVHVSKFCAILYMDASRHSVPPNGSRAHEALLFDYEKKQGSRVVPSFHPAGSTTRRERRELRRERWCV